MTETTTKRKGKKKWSKERYCLLFYMFSWLGALFWAWSALMRRSICRSRFICHGHTLAQNNLWEFWCGMHLTRKNTPNAPDRSGSVKRPEKNWKGAIAMSSARWNKLTDCENRANREIWKQVIWKRHGGSWVGHTPCPKKKPVRDKGVPSSYHHGKAVSSLVDDCQTMHPPPA